ncbi:MobQ family relaxase [Gracilibacillus saliphilus]|uniref:MobQ family relaxase n=1 Tax=Gracilibacillus saliphilus TaxID=543890 RepID=UPI0013D482B2|nr:MobQ family relaxase [Gracilibacillus saliphilus]
MGYYHLSANIISRGKGQSAVASASYRSGEKLWCEDDQEYKNYRTREVKPETMILAPKHAPDFVYDREKLWNEVEQVEGSINSRLSREIRVALPKELSNERQIELVKNYSEENFVDRGMVADIAIHREKKHNPHAHIMLTVRPFNEDGSWGKKQKKVYVLDENGNKTKTENGNIKSKTIQLTDWDKKESLQSWRENWAEKVNEFYKEAGVNNSVSHESYEKQGIDKYATHRLTYDEWKAEQEAQIQAQINSEEYEPVTHMGMVNQDIRDTKKLKDILEKEIISLEEYKDALEKEINEEYIPHVRNKFPLSNQQSEALEFVAKRIHGYVTYESAKKNMETVKDWGKAIDLTGKKLGVEAIMLDKAQNDYKVDHIRAIRYGLSPKRFEEEKGQKNRTINSKVNKYERDIEAYKKAEYYSDIAFEVQKEILHKEFGEVYPQYSHIKEDHNKLISDLKNEYVQDYLKTGYKHESIKEFEDTQVMKHYTSEWSKDIDLKKDLQENQHNLLIANRTVSKYSKEYKVIYSEGATKDKIYDAKLKLEIAKYQVKKGENQKYELDVRLNKTLSFKYQNQPTELIERIPTKLKGKLLELHLDERATGELSKDLKTVEKDLAKVGKDISHLYDKEFVEATASIGGVAKLFGDLGNQSQNNDKDVDEIKRKSKSKMKGKTLHKENEMEL